MGVGQHYNQAALLGKYFSYKGLSLKNKSNPKKQGYRYYDIGYIKKNKLFKLEDITLKEIENLVDFKEAEKLFTNHILDKTIENQLEIEKYEKMGFDILEDFIPSSKKDSKYYQYFALHNARNITNYIFIRKYLYEQLILKKRKNIKEIFNDLNYWKVVSCNKAIIKEIEEEKNKHTNFENIHNFEKFARIVFNKIYPILWVYKTNLYSNNRYWLCCELIEKESFSFGTTLVIDFKDPVYKKLNQIDLFINLSKDCQKIIKNAVIIVQGKNKVSIGIENNNQMKKIIKELNDKKINHLSLWNEIKNFFNST